jgi:hypothetical protein
VISSLPDEVPELPLDVFISYLLPKVGISDTELKKVQKNVHGRLYDSKQKAWPLGNSLKEVKDFEGFGKLQVNIVEEAEKLLRRKPKVDFLSDGNKVPESDWAFHKTRPDGGVYLRTHATATQLHWKNTCRVDEYKVRGKDKDKDDVSIPISSIFSFITSLPGHRESDLVDALRSGSRHRPPVYFWAHHRGS